MNFLLLLPTYRVFPLDIGLLIPTIFPAIVSSVLGTFELPRFTGSHGLTLTAILIRHPYSSTRSFILLCLTSHLLTTLLHRPLPLSLLLYPLIYPMLPAEVATILSEPTYTPRYPFCSFVRQPPKLQFPRSARDGPL